MVSKTVLLFPSQVKPETVKVMEEIVNDRNDWFVHIESVTSHSIRLVSLQPDGYSAINEVLSEFMRNTSYMTSPGIGFDHQQNTTYVKMGTVGSSGFSKSDVDKVKGLFK